MPANLLVAGMARSYGEIQLALLTIPYFTTTFQSAVGRASARHVGLKPDLRDTDDLSLIMESSIIGNGVTERVAGTPWRSCPALRV